MQKFFACTFQGDKSYFMLISFYFAILSFLFNKLTLILIWGVFRVLRSHMSSFAIAFFLDIFFNTKNREKYLILFLKKKNYEMMPYDEKKNVFSSKEYTTASYLYSCLRLHSKNSSLVFNLHIYIKMNVLLSFVPIYDSVNMF